MMVCIYKLADKVGEDLG